MNIEDEKNRRANRLLENTKMNPKGPMFTRDKVVDLKFPDGSILKDRIITEELTVWQWIKTQYVDWWNIDDDYRVDHLHILDWIHTGVFFVLSLAFCYWMFSI